MDSPLRKDEIADDIRGVLPSAKQGDECKIIDDDGDFITKGKLCGLKDHDLRDAACVKCGSIYEYDLDNCECKLKSKWWATIISLSFLLLCCLIGGCAWFLKKRSGNTGSFVRMNDYSITV
eukprot:TRINITY_DN66_c0_g1_i9.p1 TRINITY_DN66_c0_g1~~TRINITY_DN66_c0_g1_i9.p1  ORF type:complete len:121 (+),score=16.74 TRINITY_DN66_c0_g1_i9:51-413(+)